jgi:hypothetical protein
MQRLRALLLVLPLALGTGCAVAADVTPVHGGGYYGYAQPYYAPPPPRYYAPQPVYRPYYAPPRYWAPPPRPHWGHGYGHGRHWN